MYMSIFIYIHTLERAKLQRHDALRRDAYWNALRSKVLHIVILFSQHLLKSSDSGRGASSHAFHR